MKRVPHLITALRGGGGQALWMRDCSSGTDNRRLLSRDRMRASATDRTAACGAEEDRSQQAAEVLITVVEVEVAVTVEYTIGKGLWRRSDSSKRSPLANSIPSSQIR
jgi:hypothetical protein